MTPLQRVARFRAQATAAAGQVSSADGFRKKPFLENIRGSGYSVRLEPRVKITIGIRIYPHTLLAEQARKKGVITAREN